MKKGSRANAITAAAMGAITASLLAGCVEAEPDGTRREVRASETTAASAKTAPSEEHLPQFTDDGQLLRPKNWETWVLAGTSMGLTYAENPRKFAPGEAPGSFLQVYIQPWAYDSFMEEGEFPEGTMFILAGSEPVSKADPARGGFYQGNLFLMEVHLKQEGIDASGWAFFGYGEDTEAAEQFPGSASCYSCHAENADHDNVFVQFYPKIRERLGMPAPAAEGPRPVPPAAGGAGETAAAVEGDGQPCGIREFLASQCRSLRGCPTKLALRRAS